jgi:peptidylprolyl isomerase
MAQAKLGDTVKTHYRGTLEDGTLFDTSEGRELLQFTLGRGQVIYGFEQAVIGMEPGETKTVTIPADEAYGPKDEDMIFAVDRKELPSDMNPQPGDQLQMTEPNGQSSVVTVAAVSESEVTMDANHPLAGRELNFHIELVDFA